MFCKRQTSCTPSHPINPFLFGLFELMVSEHRCPSRPASMARQGQSAPEKKPGSFFDSLFSPAFTCAEQYYSRTGAADTLSIQVNTYRSCKARENGLHIPHRLTCSSSKTYTEHRNSWVFLLVFSVSIQSFPFFFLQKMST